MALAEFSRKGVKPSKYLDGISQNSELLKIITDLKPERLLLYRCGLIINKNILKTGIPILNFHAAKIPDYGGIGSINKALMDKIYNQFASLHKVSEHIDRGKLIDKENYVLNPQSSYTENEGIAYAASLRLLIRNFNKY